MNNLFDGVLFARTQSEHTDWVPHTRNGEPWRKRRVPGPGGKLRWYYEPVPPGHSETDAQRMLADPQLNFSDATSRSILADALEDSGRSEESALLRDHWMDGGSMIHDGRVWNTVDLAVHDAATFWKNFRKELRQHPVMNEVLKGGVSAGEGGEPAGLVHVRHLGVELLPAQVFLHMARANNTGGLVIKEPLLHLARRITSALNGRLRSEAALRGMAWAHRFMSSPCPEAKKFSHVEVRQMPCCRSRDLPDLYGPVGYYVSHAWMPDLTVKHPGQDSGQEPVHVEFFMRGHYMLHPTVAEAESQAEGVERIRYGTASPS